MTWEQPQATRFADGRLHLQHGPIDLIIEGFGQGAEAGYLRAVDHFQTVLVGLVAELPTLRQPITDGLAFDGKIAQAMAAATRIYAPRFITPMAAVAGAVADYILAALVDGPDITKAYVNNGGDVAFFLMPGDRFNAGLFAEQPGAFVIDYRNPARGIATSGWRGRSHSLGIADAVTVLADTAAQADAAATLIANAVDLPGSPKIERQKATDLAPDSELGDRLVTTDVGALTDNETTAALDRGTALAMRAAASGWIHSAFLQLNGQSQFAGQRRAFASIP